MYIPLNIIKRFYLTEKSKKLILCNKKYTFIVYPNVTRTKIKNSISSIYNKKVERVNIINYHRKLNSKRKYRKKRASVLKKAIVTFKEHIN